MKFARTDLAWIVTQLIIMGALLLSPSVWIIATLVPFHSLGLGVATLGLVVAGVATLQLLGGKSLTPMPTPRDDAELQTAGMFRHVRHPIYSCLLLWALGVTIAAASLLHLALFALLWLFFNAKAAYEEVKLADKFPEYAEYAARTRRFIPIPLPLS